MDQSDNFQIQNSGLDFRTAGKLSLMSKFFIFVGLASLLVSFFSIGRNILLVLDMDSFTTWDSPGSFLFYLPAGVILLMTNQVYRKSQMPNWKLGGAVGFAVYVSLHWLTDLGTELHVPDFFVFPLFLAFQVADILWGPIFHFIMVSFGSVIGWIDTLGTSWFATIPFVTLGMLYANAKKGSWQSGLLAVIVSLFFIFLCLAVLWFMLLLSFL